MSAYIAQNAVPRCHGHFAESDLSNCAMNCDMAYDALTIDTSLAIQGGLNLEAGLLGQLTQFKGGQLDLILSEIVVREIRKHLNLQLKKVRDALVTASARAEEVRLVEGLATKALQAEIDALGQPKVVADSRLKSFLEATGATVIPVELAAMEGVVSAYFSSAPPFEASGPKKSEFPDAIALMSIEAWAREAGKKVLAVSQDAGWVAFAEGSEWVYVEQDFAKALQILQEHADEARSRISLLLAEIEAGRLSDIAEAIQDGLQDRLPDCFFSADGHSAYYLEADTTELEYISHELIQTEEGYDITIVRLGSNQVVARIGTKITANARADFSLLMWDSIDKEHLCMGSQNAEREVEFDAAFLLTLAGDLVGSLAELEVEEIEIVDVIDYVDFGEIEMEHYEDEDDYRTWLAEEAKDGAN